MTIEAFLRLESMRQQNKLVGSKLARMFTKSKYPVSISGEQRTFEPLYPVWILTVCLAGTFWASFWTGLVCYEL